MKFWNHFAAAAMMMPYLLASDARAGEAANALVKEFGLRTYTVTRKDDDFYDVIEGYVVKTKYCYAYVYYSKAVITENKIIFIDHDDVCDIEGIYRK